MQSPGDVFCTTTEFKANLRHYKQVAKTNFVHITEHGHASRVLVSVEAFEARKAERIHQAKWQVWAENACFRGLHEDDAWPLDLTPRVAIEYLGQPWDGCVAASFDDDVRRWELSNEQFQIVRQCLERLRVNRRAGRQIDVGPEAYLPEHVEAYRLNAGSYDIIYGLDADNGLRVYGLVQAL
ncbi:MAG: type II toxin-antitoxin system Phd/YefM family antitoxin [Eggerthellaceae bacterium]|nr:type II toxin-antitoxin system Phd/YefM family antitoxin [Eggerthellaceae bacterium]